MMDIDSCPFCGGEASYWWKWGKHGRFIYIACDTCEAQTKIFGTREDPDDDDFWDCPAAHKAAKHWNRRTGV